MAILMRISYATAFPDLYPAKSKNLKSLNQEFLDELSKLHRRTLKPCHKTEFQEKFPPLFEKLLALAYNTQKEMFYITLGLYVHKALENTKTFVIIGAIPREEETSFLATLGISEEVKEKFINSHWNCLDWLLRKNVWQGFPREEPLV